MSYCTNCGAVMSEKAISCPACGEPTNIKQGKPRWGGGLLAALMVGTSIIPLVGFISGGIAFYRGQTDHGWWLTGFGLLMAIVYAASM